MDFKHCDDLLSATSKINYDSHFKISRNIGIADAKPSAKHSKSITSTVYG